MAMSGISSLYICTANHLIISVRNQLAVISSTFGSKMGSHRSQSATAIDSAKHLTIFDVERHIATNHTSRQRILTEATTAAKDITIYT